MSLIIRNENINWFNTDQIRIAHLSDIHIWFSNKKLLDLESKINLLKPDLILLTGDYFDTVHGAKLFSKFLKNISEKFTVVFIKGNHDCFISTKIYESFSSISNCLCVDNQVYTYITKKNNIINITSWDNKACLSNNTKNIVLMHNPEKIKEHELVNANLILAGHLHGGQFVFFKTQNGSSFPGNILYKYCVDRKDFGNTILMVSKGLGDTFPFRFNCNHEIICVEIS